MKSCSCIIPFYNEYPRILKVLDQVIQIKSVDEIICVDDGSIDNASAFIRKLYPKIKIITLPKNSGKTETISKGLKKSKGYYILLLDADLRNFNHKYVEDAVSKMKSNQSVDLIILRRVNAPFIIKLNRGDTLLSGERTLKRADLIKLLNMPNRPKGYQLEFAMNQYMMANKKEVYWMPSSALNTYPLYKRGFVKGIYKTIKMQLNILTYIGLINFLKQELFFCRKRLMLNSS